MACVVSCMFLNVCVFWLMIKNILFICSAILVNVYYSRFLSIKCSFCLFESISAEWLPLYITNSKTFLLRPYHIIYFPFRGKLCSSFVMSDVFLCIFLSFPDNRGTSRWKLIKFVIEMV